MNRELKQNDKALNQKKNPSGEQVLNQEKNLTDELVLNQEKNLTDELVLNQEKNLTDELVLNQEKNLTDELVFYRELERNIARIREDIRLAGRSDVLIVPATKTVDADRISMLKDFGVFAAGENRVQELLQKYPIVQGLDWHFIGDLQRNKVKYIVDKVCLIHSLDNVPLANEIEKRAAKIGKVMDVLVEVNIGREESKSGVLCEDLLPLCEYVAGLKNLRLRGLMSVMPASADESLYARMNQLFVEIKGRYQNIDFLSVGMSGDYAIALKYGANIIRPGSAIFGARAYKNTKD